MDERRTWASGRPAAAARRGAAERRAAAARRASAACRTALAIAAACLGLAAAGCGRVPEGVEPAPAHGDAAALPAPLAGLAGRPVRAVATTGMVADLVARIGGERVRVRALMGPGIDPHSYKASEGDVQRLQAADVVFYNGLHLEARLAHVFARMHGRIQTVAVAAAIPPDRLLRAADGGEAVDPHVWFDVSLWRLAAARVGEALAALDPAHAGDYAGRLTACLAELDSLDAYVRARAASLPEARRVLITAHDAFGYFGRAYGFEVLGLQGISTAAEAGTADVQRLAALIAERGVPALFAETSVSPRAIEAVRAAARARGREVSLGGALYSDALGAAGTPAGSYDGMVRHNIDTIVAGLGGPAGPAGSAGSTDAGEAAAADRPGTPPADREQR